ncbi:uncharacterized protein LOC143288699 [Babylonia areolata]|uniref:uncharacterized protein LOC143288699 n=1 Tax=Babylonia areolata TaxID=304850 RepID=UPI003FD25E56
MSRFKFAICLLAGVSAAYLEKPQTSDDHDEDNRATIGTAIAVGVGVACIVAGICCCKKGKNDEQNPESADAAGTTEAEGGGCPMIGESSEPVAMEAIVVTEESDLPRGESPVDGGPPRKAPTDQPGGCPAEEGAECQPPEAPPDQASPEPPQEVERCSGHI